MYHLESEHADFIAAFERAWTLLERAGREWVDYVMHWAPYVMEGAEVKEAGWGAAYAENEKHGNYVEFNLNHPHVAHVAYWPEFLSAAVIHEAAHNEHVANGGLPKGQAAEAYGDGVADRFARALGYHWWREGEPGNETLHFDPLFAVVSPGPRMAEPGEWTLQPSKTDPL